MGRISRRKINPEIEERLFEMFWNHLSTFKNAQETQDFFASLLSHTEKVMLAKRLAIAVLLSKDLTYEEISEIIKVSKSTIGTVHKQILIGATGYKNAVKSILSGEHKEAFFNKLESLSFAFSLPKQYGSLGWQKKSETGKKLSKRKRQLSNL